MYKEDYNLYKTMVDNHILDFFPEIDHKSIGLFDSIKYSLTSPGKRIRPVLLLAACEFCGGNIKAAMPFACAVEYIHTYSLIHDDLPALDNDDLRRGIPTNHKMFGEAAAILAGDGLLSAAFEIMCKDLFLYFDNEDEAKHRIKAMNEIVKGAGCRGLVSGQFADMEAENKTCSKEMLDYIHINKTGALIVAAVRAGAFLGNCTEEELSDLTIFGECLGLAFQIEDDLLDKEGSPKEMGKKTGVDQAKCTYVKVYGVEKSKEEVRRLNERAMSVLSKYYDNAEFFTEMVRELGARSK